MLVTILLLYLLWFFQNRETFVCIGKLQTLIKCASSVRVNVACMFKAAWRSHPQIPSFSILNILRFAFSVSSN